LLDIADDGTTAGQKIYYFGRNNSDAYSDHTSNGGTDPSSSITDTIGYLSFDDQCSLITTGLWDANGKVRDCGKWDGWYKSQPQVMFTNSFFKNSGKTAPATYQANGLEMDYTTTSGNQYHGNDTTGELYNTSTWINLGLGATTGATVDTLPDAPPADARVERIEPFWFNTGNWVDLNKLSKTTFENVFGVTIEGADFNSVFDVNEAILINTANAGSQIRMKITTLAADGSLILTDSDGDILDSDNFDGSADTKAMAIPTDANYYILPFTDTTKAKIQKWDSVTVSPAGSITFDTFAGISLQQFLQGTAPTALPWLGPSLDYEAWIPAGGISVQMIIPATSNAVNIGFLRIENTTTIGSVEGSISTTPFDFAAIPNQTWGLTAGIGGAINPTVVLDSTARELIVGETYYFNVRFSNLSNGFLRLQMSRSGTF